MSDDYKKISTVDMVLVTGLGFAATFGLAAALLVGRDKYDEDKYVVTDKGTKTIIYAPLENKKELHVMQFDTDNKYRAAYNNINVGDTICGEDLSVSSAQPVRTIKGDTVSNIQTVNGKPFQELCGLKQKQR